MRLSLRAGLVTATLAFAGCEDEPAKVVCGPETTDAAPEHLACAGLYTDFEAKAVTPRARAYAPAVSFWSDGYEKSRWIDLPDGASIDASAPDEWRFPVGTKVWKEFRFRERRVETRLLWKVTADRWIRAAYVWSEDGTTATRGEGKSLTIAGAPYHVPRDGECKECHDGRRDTLLGFEAVSLGQPAATGVTLAVLAQENRLAPPPTRTTLAIDPGLGVLHVNCGVSCHNGAATAAANASSMRLRIGFEEATTKPVETWEIFTSTVGVPAQLPGWSGKQRIARGAPEASAIPLAMSTRGTGQMPPSTTLVDGAGVTAVEGFVRALPTK